MGAGVRCHSTNGIETSSPWCFHSFIIDWYLGPGSHCNFSSFLPAKLLHVLFLSLWTMFPPSLICQDYLVLGKGRDRQGTSLLSGSHWVLMCQQLLSQPREYSSCLGCSCLLYISSRSLTFLSGLMILNLKHKAFPLSSQPTSSFLQKTNQDRLLSHRKEGRVAVTGNNLITGGGKSVRHPLLLIIFSHPRFVKCHPYAQELETQREEYEKEFALEVQSLLGIANQPKYQCIHRILWNGLSRRLKT